MLKSLKSNSQKTEDLASKEITKSTQKESNMNISPTYFNVVRIY